MCLLTLKAESPASFSTPIMTYHGRFNNRQQKRATTDLHRALKNDSFVLILLQKRIAGENK